jgi:nucleotide-binding universal stress UspA family protein
MSTLGSAPVLICYDRSEDSRRAIVVAGSLFAGREAIILHVWTPFAMIAAAYGGRVSLPSYDDRELQKAALVLSKEGTRIATEAGLVARAEIAQSTHEGTARTILTIADERDAALIVTGARGLSAFKSFVLGSVSHGVVQHAHRPVLVVPPPPATAAS